MVDADTDIARNEATRIGDVEVYEPYPDEALLAMSGPGTPGGAGWGVPGDAPQAPWWPAPPAGAGGGAGLGAQGYDLAVQKTIVGPCQPGGPCDFVIVMTNTGTLPATQPITIVDELANDWNLSGFGPAGSLWNCQQTGTQLACTHPAPNLNPGEAGAVNVTLQVPAGQVAGEWQNCAVLDHGPGGGDVDPGNDQGCALLRFGPEAPAEQPDLAIAKNRRQRRVRTGQTLPVHGQDQQLRPGGIRRHFPVCRYHAARLVVR